MQSVFCGADFTVVLDPGDPPPAPPPSVTPSHPTPLYLPFSPHLPQSPPLALSRPQLSPALSPALSLPLSPALTPALTPALSLVRCPHSQSSPRPHRCPPPRPRLAAPFPCACSAGLISRSCSTTVDPPLPHPPWSTPPCPTPLDLPLSLSLTRSLSRSLSLSSFSDQLSPSPLSPTSPPARHPPPSSPYQIALSKLQGLSGPPPSHQTTQRNLRSGY